MSAKHSVYLRKEWHDFAQALCEQNGTSIPEAILKLIADHRKISQVSPNIVLAARLYACQDSTRVYQVQAFSEKIVFSLTFEDSNYLRKFAAEFSDKNISVAVNIIAAECWAMAALLSESSRSLA